MQLDIKERTHCVNTCLSTILVSNKTVGQRCIEIPLLTYLLILRWKML